MNFTIKNCKFVIDFSFVLVLSFSALFDAQKVIMLVLYSSLHEFGHLLVLLLCGGEPKTLTFSFYGLGLKYNDKLSRVKELAVIIAGPLVNLILWLFTKDEINLLLFILNSLPLYPLDGGRVVRLFSYNLSKILSAIFIIIIFALSIYLIVFCKSFSLLFISIYLFFYTICY